MVEYTAIEGGEKLTSEFRPSILSSFFTIVKFDENDYCHPEGNLRIFVGLFLNFYGIIKPSMEGQKQNRKNWQFIGLMFALGVFAGLFRIAKAQTCTPFWSCTVWSTCSNGTQARTCQDLNYCGLTRHPIELQDCATGPEIVPDVNPNEEQPILPPEPAATPSGCLPIWSCTVWSACEGNQQIRTCRDAQNCGVSASQPAEVIACSSAPSGCTPSWSCAAWSLCVNGMQERGCTDVHSCSTESGRPPQSRSCTIPTPTPTPSPTTPGNPPTSEPAPGNCVSDWTCSIWSTCLSGSQTSTCTDANSCGTTSGKPTEQQSCSSGAVCSPAWACTAWSTCSNGAQTRTCTDANSCGITTGRPVQQQNCSADVSPSPTPTSTPSPSESPPPILPRRTLLMFPAVPARPKRSSAGKQVRPQTQMSNTV